MGVLPRPASYSPLLPRNILPTPEQLAGIDFSDHSSHVGILLGITITSITLVAVVTVLRTWVRVGTSSRIFVDDGMAMTELP
jgi:hypothetical protein